MLFRSAAASCRPAVASTASSLRERLESAGTGCRTGSASEALAQPGRSRARSRQKRTESSRLRMSSAPFHKLRVVARATQTCREGEGDRDLAQRTARQAVLELVPQRTEERRGEGEVDENGREELHALPHERPVLLRPAVLQLESRHVRKRRVCVANARVSRDSRRMKNARDCDSLGENGPNCATGDSSPTSLTNDARMTYCSPLTRPVNRPDHCGALSICTCWLSTSTPPCAV